MLFSLYAKCKNLSRNNHLSNSSPRMNSGVFLPELYNGMQSLRWKLEGKLKNIESQLKKVQKAVTENRKEKING